MPEARRPAVSSGRSLREIDNLVTGVMTGSEFLLTVRMPGLGGPDPVAMLGAGSGGGLAQVPLVPVRYEPTVAGGEETTAPKIAAVTNLYGGCIRWHSRNMNDSPASAAAHPVARSTRVSPRRHQLPLWRLAAPTASEFSASLARRKRPCHEVTMHRIGLLPRLPIPGPQW